MKKQVKVGKMDKKVIDLLGLSFNVNQAIFLSETNERHMQSEHPEEYEKYFSEVCNIITNPDYVGLHPNGKSIEYFKHFYNEGEEERILVAVRASRSGVLFARSLYIVTDDTFNRYLEKDTVKQYK